MPEPLAQRFRKLQHDVFGLSETEWAALERFLLSHDKIGIAVQRNAWFEREILDYGKLTSSVTNTNG